MRFMVDLYRLLILLILAIALVVGTWLGISLAAGPLSTDPQRMLYTVLLIGGAIATILALGITATFISIHDRIAEIADQAQRVAASLERAPIVTASAVHS